MCHVLSQRIDLYEVGYEFRPPFYHSVECKHPTEKHHRSNHHNASSTYHGNHHDGPQQVSSYFSTESELCFKDMFVYNL